MHPRTWTLLFTTVALYSVLNFVPRPGVGPRLPPKPPGFELERYFGWPSTYRAELWESDDPHMTDRDIGSFRVYEPSSEMELAVREFGRGAAAVDLLFVLALLIMTGVASEAKGRREWRRREVAALFGCVVGLAALYLAGDFFAVSL